MKLTYHPKYPAHDKLSLSSDIMINGDACHIRYEVKGDTTAIKINDTSHDRAFRDELWKMTCFEMFVQPGDGPHYYEYNFAPNGDWASYHFDQYRSGMRPIEIAQPKIDLKRNDNMVSAHVILDKYDLPAGDLKIGLFAMIFSENDRSFWALDHSESTPNFHQSDCFMYLLTAR